MKIANRTKLDEFAQKHRDIANALTVWTKDIELTSWRTPQDILDRYPNARTLPDNRVIFNIKGNRYRLIVRVNYAYGVVQIRFIGTHEDYDRIDAETI